MAQGGFSTVSTGQDCF